MQNSGDLCRICLQSHSNMTSIYSQFSDQYSEPIYCMIMYCASVNIEKEDGLPDLVCTLCKERLEIAYLFRRDCEQSEIKLRQKSENIYKWDAEESTSSYLEAFSQNFNTDIVKVEVSETEVLNYDKDDSRSLNNLPNASIKSENSSNDEDYKAPTEKRSKRKIKRNIRSQVKKVNISLNPRLKRILCFVCSAVFATQADCDHHSREKHPDYAYVCEFDDCDESFKDYMSLANHRKKIHKVKAYYKCQECEHAYTDRKNLYRHVYTKHGDRPYTCTHCAKTFRENAALEEHLKICHLFKCPLCKKVTTSYSNLESHLNTHSVDKPYKCTNCDKKFNNKKNLSRHEKIAHQRAAGVKRISAAGVQREKNHLCSYCGRIFKAAEYLSKHLRTHTAGKPFSCDRCTFSCRNKQNLANHLRTHTGEKPFKCRYCDKSFSSRGYLTIHERYHSGYRPYKCKTCQKGFTNSKDLKVHERTHTGIKLFHCDICDSSFTTLHYLRVHVSKHGVKKNL